jgi:hypothetical protein
MSASISACGMSLGALLMNVMDDRRPAPNGDPKCVDELFPSGVPDTRVEESSCSD